MAKSTHRSKATNALQKATSELFRTRPETYLPLFRKFPKLIEGCVLDPSAGDGRWIKDIIAGGNTSRHAIYDIRDLELKSWKNNGLIRELGEKNCKIVPDWLKEERPRYFDNIITNPPFSLARAFVNKGLKWLHPDGHITLLHRLNWLGTFDRSRWLNDSALKYVIVIAKRPVFEMDGREKNIADTYEYAFFVFQKGYAGAPRVKWSFPDD